MFKGPERRGGSNSYCMRVVLVGLFLACVLAYLLYYLYISGVVDDLIRFLF